MVVSELPLPEGRGFKRPKYFDLKYFFRESRCADILCSRGTLYALWVIPTLTAIFFQKRVLRQIDCRILIPFVVLTTNTRPLTVFQCQTWMDSATG